MTDISKIVIGNGHNRPTEPVALDPNSFPDQLPGGRGIPSTVANVRYMLEANAIEVRYNVITKRTEITVPWLNVGSDNADSSSMTHIQSLAAKHQMPTGMVPAIIEAIGDERAYNPARDWIQSRPWDHIDRLQDVCNTITVTEGYPVSLRDFLVKKWLLSVAAAAVLPDGFRCRGVLTLQGPQGIGKTTWGLQLINDKVLRTQLMKVDHHLDAGNKDSQLGAIDHLIVEIGELESSLKRDISRLKGFLTAGTDKVRRPYAKVATETQRRTVFYATVNSPDFLVDSTGNTRFWTIACAALDFDHGIDMQQVFAQCAELLAEGHQWWLTSEEEAQLEAQNDRHRSFSVVRDRLAEILDIDGEGGGSLKTMTASEVLIEADFSNPTNSQAKECATYLREWFGDSKRINGRDKWRVAFRPGGDGEGTHLSATPPSTSKSRFD